MCFCAQNFRTDLAYVINSPMSSIVAPIFINYADCLFLFFIYFFQQFHDTPLSLVESLFVAHAKAHSHAGTQSLTQKLVPAAIYEVPEYSEAIQEGPLSQILTEVSEYLPKCF